MLQVADERLPGVAAAARVVERAEQLADGAQWAAMSPGVTRWPGPRSVWRALPGHGGAALHGDAGRCSPLVTRSSARPISVAAGYDEPGRGEGDLAEFGVAAGVLAPQAADDVDGLSGDPANSRPA